MSVHICIYDRVTLANSNEGEVQFMGMIENKNGIFYGIKLDEPIGKNNGSVANISYFECDINYGIFVTINKIKKSLQTPFNKVLPRVTIGDKVYIKHKRMYGVLRYVGTISNKDGCWYGVELEEPMGQNNGSVDNRSYFECMEYYGIFCQMKNIEPADKKKKGHNQPTSKSDISQIKSNYKAKKTPIVAPPPPMDEPASPNSPKKPNLLEIDIESMGFIQLKARCGMEGLSTFGTKKQLLGRLRQKLNKPDPNAKNTTKKKPKPKPKANKKANDLVDEDGLHDLDPTKDDFYKPINANDDDDDDDDDNGNRGSVVYNDNDNKPKKNTGAQMSALQDGSEDEDSDNQNKAYKNKRVKSNTPPAQIGLGAATKPPLTLSKSTPDYNGTNPNNAPTKSLPTNNKANNNQPPQQQATGTGPAKDWIMLPDPSTGKMYYANLKTRETRWQPPPGFGVQESHLNPQYNPGIQYAHSSTNMVNNNWGNPQYNQAVWQQQANNNPNAPNNNQQPYSLGRQVSPFATNSNTLGFNQNQNRGMPPKAASSMNMMNSYQNPNLPVNRGGMPPKASSSMNMVNQFGGNQNQNQQNQNPNRNNFKPQMKNSNSSPAVVATGNNNSNNSGVDPLAQLEANKWKKTKDPSTGKMYWYHKDTKQTTWDTPLAVKKVLGVSAETAVSGINTMEQIEKAEWEEDDSTSYSSSASYYSDGDTDSSTDDNNSNNANTNYNKQMNPNMNMNMNNQNMNMQNPNMQNQYNNMGNQYNNMNNMNPQQNMMMNPQQNYNNQQMQLQQQQQWQQQQYMMQQQRMQQQKDEDARNMYLKPKGNNNNSNNNNKKNKNNKNSSSNSNNNNNSRNFDDIKTSEDNPWISAEEAKSRVIVRDTLKRYWQIGAEQTFKLEDWAKQQYARDLHKKGVFSKKLQTISDLLSFADHGKLKHPLNKTSSDDNKFESSGLQTWKNINSYMGNRKSGKSSEGHVEKLIRFALKGSPKLRNEIYCQLAKQTTKNPKINSLLCGWKLLLMCCSFFPPSDNFVDYLACFIWNNTQQPNEIGQYAIKALHALDATMLSGARKFPPLPLEIVKLENLQPIPLNIYFINGMKCKQVLVTSQTRAKQVIDTLTQTFNFIHPEAFGLYEMEPNIAQLDRMKKHYIKREMMGQQEKINDLIRMPFERELEDDDRMLDVIASWLKRDQSKRRNKDKKGKNGKKRKKHKSSKNVRFVLKVKTFRKSMEKSFSHMGSKANFLTHVWHFINDFYPITANPVDEEFAFSLAALQLQGTYGPKPKLKPIHNSKFDQHAQATNNTAAAFYKQGLIAYDLHKYLPQLILKKYLPAKRNECEMKILQFRNNKFCNMSRHDSWLRYAKLLRNNKKLFGYFGCAWYRGVRIKSNDDNNQQMNNNDNTTNNTNDLLVGINEHAITFANPITQNIVERYQMEEILTFGYRSNAFLFVAGTLMTQTKMQIATMHGKAMNRLVRTHIDLRVRDAEKSGRKINSKNLPKQDI